METTTEEEGISVGALIDDLKVRERERERGREKREEKRDEATATDDAMRVNERGVRAMDAVDAVGGVVRDGAVRARGVGEAVRRDDDARDDGMTDETRDAERGRRTASAIDRETAHDRARARTGSVEG